jgi:hypothetical protein
VTLMAVEGLAKLAPACKKNTSLQFGCVWGGKLKRKQAETPFSPMSTKVFPWHETFEVPLVGEVETLVIDLAAKGLQLGSFFSTSSKGWQLGSTKLKVSACLDHWHLFSS